MKSLLASLWNALIDASGACIGRPLRWGIARKWIYFPFVSEALSMIPFSLGWKLRRAVYARILPRIGRTAVLHFGATLEDERTMIGDNVWISRGSYVDLADVGDDVLIGPYAILLAGGHHHRFDRLDVPIKDQGNPPKEPLRIGKGAWIGGGAIVVASIGEGAIVGAGAVVTKPVPSLAIVAGNPARPLRMRDGSALPGSDLAPPSRTP